MMLEFFSIDASSLDGGTLVALVVFIALVTVLTSIMPRYEWREQVRKDAETYRLLSEVAGNQPTDMERCVLLDLRHEMFDRANDGMRAKPWLYSLAINVATMLEIVAILVAIFLIGFNLLFHIASNAANFPQFLIRALPLLICALIALLAGINVLQHLYCNALYYWDCWQTERNDMNRDETPTAY